MIDKISMFVYFYSCVLCTEKMLVQHPSEFRLSLETYVYLNLTVKVSSQILPVNLYYEGPFLHIYGGLPLKLVKTNENIT
jgi:hypothetical protein